MHAPENWRRGNSAMPILRPLLSRATLASLTARCNPSSSSLKAVGGSGFSFHSDQPLLAGGASAEASPEGKGAPARGAVAGVAAQPPSAAAQQQQQQQAGVRYSDQYPPSPEQAARRGQRPQLAVALPAASSTEQQSSSGGAEVSLNGGMAQVGGWMRIGQCREWC